MANKTLPSLLVSASTPLDVELADLDVQIATLTARRTAPRAQANGNTKRHRQRDRPTDRKITVLKMPGFYADGGNLYLDFKDPPSKNWVLRYTRKGRTHDYGLGAYPSVSLAEARLARDLVQLKLLRKGLDGISPSRAWQESG